MKITAIIGFIIGALIIILTIFFKGNFHYFLDFKALLITLGGTLASVLIFFSYHALYFSIKAFWKIFSEKEFSGKEVVEHIVKLNRDITVTGLEKVIDFESVKELPFLRNALILLQKEKDLNVVKEILTRESQSIYRRNKIAEQVFKVAGDLSPMFGMMGSVIGLITMLNKLEDPSTIPPAMGLALITTLYGLILSALIFKPIAGKIKDKNIMDTRARQIIIEGISLIAKKENSFRTKQILTAYLI